MGADHNTGIRGAIIDPACFPPEDELANLPRMSKRPLGFFGNPTLLLAASIGLSAGACIMRTATPPGAPAAAPAPSAATVAAEDRVAGLPRVDLLAGAGVGAFKVEGDVQKVELAPISVTGQPFTDAVRATVKEGSGHEWAVQ